jgi:hypothetical protein
MDAGRTRVLLSMAVLGALTMPGPRMALSQAAIPAAAEPAPPPAGNPSGDVNPIAIVPVDAAIAGQAATVTGALRVTGGKALITTSGTVTAGTKTADVVLPRRGVLHVCASTSVHLSTDATVPAGETPGLMMALDHGAVEASFATGRNSDTLLTPDFRILIGGPGAADVKVRLGQHGDTCVENAGPNAPYVLVSSVFEGGAYRVQTGQRVMFQHGSLKEVVDQEKEPCGCPPDPHPGSNDFPLAQSAGLAPLEKPASPPAPTAKPQQELSQPLVYSAPAAPEPAVQPPPAPAPAAATLPAALPAQPPAPAKAKKKPGFLHSVGRFFKKIFGAE